MSCQIQRFLSLIAVLAIGQAQLFGLTRNHVYYQDGVPVVTVADHHHKGDGVHAGHAHDFSHHHDHDVPGEGDTEENLPQEVDFSAPPSLGTILSPTLTPVYVTELPDFLACLAVSDQDTHDHTEGPPDPGGDSQLPASLLVARCAVLLV